MPTEKDSALPVRPRARPMVVAGLTYHVASPDGMVNITINSDEDGPLEVFINVGRAGSDIAALAEALGRLISLQLRLPSGVSPPERLRQVAGQLRGIGGSRSIGVGPDRVLSLPDAVAQALLRHLDDHRGEEDERRDGCRADQSARLERGPRP